MIYAHRGISSKYAPENSMLSFKKAVYKNVGIELDVRILKDNTIIVFHDSNLFRMTGINKRIEKCNYNEIKELKLKNTNEKIPLLGNVLKEINCPLLIDIKGNKKRIVKHLIKLLNNYTNYKIQSFNKRILNLIKHKKKESIVGLISFKVKSKYDFISMPKFTINKKIKVPLFIWNINLKEINNFKKYTDTFIVDYNEL